MFELAEISKKIEDIESKTIQLFKNVNIQYNKPSSDSLTSVVFIGPYSVGKSTIVKMLTGNENIEIGEGITTQNTTQYYWNGLKIVDTPGIDTGIRPEHDQITFDEIASADLLVYVVSNETFSTKNGETFREFAIEKRKGDEMILVVNKMNRSTNSEQDQRAKREDIQKVLYPYTPEQLCLCFMNAEDYRDGKALMDENPALGQKLINRSGYAEFINTLNHCVRTKGKAAKSTTRIYEIDRQIEKAINQLSPKPTDSDIAGLIENYLQQRGTLVGTRDSLRNEVNNMFLEAGSSIRQIGLHIADLVVEGCGMDYLSLECDEGQAQAKQIVEDCQKKAFDILKVKLLEAGEIIDENEERDFFKIVKKNLLTRYKTMPESLKNTLNNVGYGANKIGIILRNNAYKSGIDSGLKLSNFSGSTVHDIVLKAGHALNYKFDAWQAVKITRGIGIAGQAMSAIGTGVTMVNNAQADKDRAAISEELRVNRQNIRNHFNRIASDFELFGKQFVEKSISSSIDKTIFSIDSSINNLRITNINRSKTVDALCLLQTECKNTIEEIRMLLPEAD